MLTETALTPMAAELAELVRGRSYGSVRILDVDAEVMTDVNGYLAVHLNLVLNNPDGPTWPLDDILDLYRSINAETLIFPEPFPVYFGLRPETDDRQD